MPLNLQTTALHATRHITARPTIVGLIGADIGPSLSPALHEREAEELGVELCL